MLWNRASLLRTLTQFRFPQGIPAGEVVPVHVSKWVVWVYYLLLPALVGSMWFTRWQHRRVLPTNMWTPKRLYTLRLSLMVQVSSLICSLLCELYSSVS